MTATPMKLKYRDLKEQTGKNAIVLRGIVEHFLTGETKLRACQMGAVAYADTLDVFVAVDPPALPSRMGRMLRDAGVFQQLDPKQKRTGYILEAGPNFEEFCDFLEENVDYGTRMDGSLGEDLQRHHLLTHLEKTGAVRANNATHKIPTKLYKLLGEKMMKGELDVIYVPAGAVVGTKHEGVTKKIDYYVD